MRRWQPYWRAFLRHRFRAHAEGWLCVAVGLLTGYFVELYAHEPLWAVVPASFLAAFFVVAMMAAVAALLRFPWWFLAPLTAVSMVIEWGLRRLFKRPWRRTPLPRERLLSNPFALWQGRRLRRLRRQRSSRPPAAQVIPFPQVRYVPRGPSSPRAPTWSAEGLGIYVLEAFEGHWRFWIFSAPVWIMLWLWLVDGEMFVVALILAVLLWLIGSFALIIPLAAAILALVSALLVGAGLTPLQRYAEVHHLAEIRVAEAQIKTECTQTASAGKQPMHWVWPLLLGLWIGHAWGDDG